MDRTTSKDSRTEDGSNVKSDKAKAKQ